jgi:parallel beta-helix repeat protein
MPARLVLLIALAALLADDARAATIFVSVDGSDRRGDGSSGRPFATITRAAASARPGDVVTVRAGVYRESAVIRKGGSRGARVVIRGESAIIDPSGLEGRSGAPADGLTVAANYVDVEGMEIRNAPGTGLVVWGAHDVRIAGNRVHGSTRSGIWVGHEERGRIWDVVVQDNVVYDNVRENVRRTWRQGWGQSIGVSRARRVTVRGNLVHRNYGEGILLTKSKDCRVIGNEVFDNFSVQIYLTYVQRTRVEGNLTYSTGDRGYYRNGQPASGIMLANETERVPEEATNANVVVNNVVLHSRWGISYWNRTPHGMRNTTIAYNTVVGATEHLLQIDPDPNNRANLVKNNIFAAEPARAIEAADVPRGAARFENNCWWPEPEADARGEGDVVAAPEFVDPAGTTALSFRLRSASPCSNAGRAAEVTDRDYAGLRRDPRTPDPGAHEDGE